tara:strand:- start:18980 stop:19999 length:1020 start_codon:yes stop_codon:yes gene_type:complete
MINKLKSIIILTLLIGVCYVNYKSFSSSPYQAALLEDWNNQSYRLRVELLEQVDLDFPNITPTTIPLKLLKGRYYKNMDSIDIALDHYHQSLKINPYLKIVESQLSLLYFDIEEYDSAYYYGKDAFLFYPDNNIHRHAYFQSLVNKRDSTELDRSFDLIRNKQNESHWIEYLLSKRSISKKYSKEIDSLMELYFEQFNLEGDTKAFQFKSFLANGDLSISTAVDISLQANELYNEKRYSEAANLYELAFSFDQYDYTYYQNAALANLNLKNYTKAEEYLDKVIYDFKIKDGKSMFYKGMLYLAIDEDNKGCEYLNQAVQANYSGEGSLVVYNRFCRNSP